MASRYDRSIRVPQSTIDEIKKLGMTKAIEKAKSGGASREFLEGAKRFYGGNRISGGSSEKTISHPPKPSNIGQSVPSNSPAVINETAAKPPTPSISQEAVSRRLTGRESGQLKGKERRGVITEEEKSRLHAKIESPSKESGRQKGMREARERREKKKADSQIAL